MSSAPVDAAFPRDARGGRQSTLVAREAWEDAWLTEQRSAMEVIRQEGAMARQSDGLAARPSDLDGEPAEYEARTGARMQAAHSNSIESSERANQSRVPERHTDRRVGPTLPGSIVLGASNSERGRLAAVAESASTTSPAKVPRFELRHSAFWRTGEAEISAAMRVPDPERLTERVIAQLREWIRDSGGYLRKVLINGRVAWNAPDSRGETPTGQRSQLNRHI